MEQIRQWGKKGGHHLEQDRPDRRAGSRPRRGLYPAERPDPAGFAPEILPVSARLALRAKLAQDSAERDPLWSESRFQAWKPTSSGHSTKEPGAAQATEPVGRGRAADRPLPGPGPGRLDLLAKDVTAIDNIESQLEIYRQDMQRDFVSGWPTLKTRCWR